MKARLLSLVLATSMTMPVLVGCERELAHEETTKTRSDGTQVHKETTVKEQSDGTIVKEQEKSVDRTADNKVD